MSSAIPNYFSWADLVPWVGLVRLDASHERQLRGARGQPQLEARSDRELAGTAIVLNVS